MEVEEVKFEPCNDCPFRRDGFIRLDPDDAFVLADFASDPGHVAICHKTEGKKRELSCVGSLLFGTGDERVFDTAEEMAAAHEVASMAGNCVRRRRPQGELWGIP